MPDNSADRDSERQRYDDAARRLAQTQAQGQSLSEIQRAPRHLWEPYESFHRAISAQVGPRSRVLEIGAGDGLHTEYLANISERVVALDVSEAALAVNKGRNPGRIHPVCADMAALPFDDGSFDVVASAGSLSYGDPDTVNAEIFRVLRPGGALLVVDSLNHNPLFRLNRWRHYRRGERTKSTLLRMPDLDRIRSLAAPFAVSSVEFFGSYLFLHPPLSRLVGPTRAAKATTWLDNRVGPDRYAFKFVLVATDFRPGESGRSAERTAANLPREASG